MSKGHSKRNAQLGRNEHAPGPGASWIELPNPDRLLDPIPGTNLWRDKPDEAQVERSDIERAVKGLMNLNGGGTRGEGIHRKLQKYRQYTQLLIAAYASLSDVNEALLRAEALRLGENGARSGKRWTEDEDEALVYAACNDNATMLTLALDFNRSPGAVQSRLTYLVGVHRISRQVVGRLTGYLDGEPVKGVFEGKIERLSGA